ATLDQRQLRRLTRRVDRAGLARYLNTPEVGAVIPVLVRQEDEVIHGYRRVLRIQIDDDITLRRLDRRRVGLTGVYRHAQLFVALVRLDVARCLHHRRRFWRCEGADLLSVCYQDTNADERYDEQSGQNGEIANRPREPAFLWASTCRRHPSDDRRT